MNTIGSTFAFQPSDAPRALDPAPSGPPASLPDREWGLTARQVVVLVVAIIAASELLGLLL